MKFICPLLMLLVFALPGQATEQADEVELENLQAELDQARLAMAEAAGRLARLERQLLELGQDRPRMFDFRFDLATDPTWRSHFAGFPPRLGILLGEPGSEEHNLVVGVTPGGGAEAAGIRKGDRIVAVDGIEIDTEADAGASVREALAERRVGDTVDVLIQRDDHTELEVAVRLGSAIRDVSAITARVGPELEDLRGQLLQLDPDARQAIRRLLPVAPPLAGIAPESELTANHSGLAGYFGTDRGVIVLRIADDNPLGLASGDVILAIDGIEVQRPVDLGRQLWGREAGSVVSLEVMRQGEVIRIDGEVSEASKRAALPRRVGMILNRSAEHPPMRY